MAITLKIALIAHHQVELEICQLWVA